MVVIGGGPAGTCAAMALAKLGANVTVYEQKHEDKFVSEDGEPYAIVLEKRGLSALEDAGFLDVDFHGSECASPLDPIKPACLPCSIYLDVALLFLRGHLASAPGSHERKA